MIKKGKKTYKNSINFKLLAIIFAGILSFAIILTVVSYFFIHSIFNSLYNEKLTISSRTLLSQYSYTDISRYIDLLQNTDGFEEDAKRYLADREYISGFKNNYEENADSPPEYEDALARLAAYYEQQENLKDDKYYAIQNRMNQTQYATGVKNLYIIADLGLNDGYVYIFNTFYQADTGIDLHDDFGTVVPKEKYPEIDQVYKTGEPVYIIDKYDPLQNGKISCSFIPVTNGRGNIIAVICVNVNLESISAQLNNFLFLIVIITAAISLIIIVMMFFLLQKTIVSPIESLTNVSAEIAKGNLYTEIPRNILYRRDEMGVLGNSYESMRTALEKLIMNNKVMFEDIITGKLDTRGDSSQFSGLFSHLIDTTNDTLDVIGIYFDSIPASFVILNPDFDMVFSNSSFRDTFAGFSAEHLYGIILDDPDEDYIRLKEKLSAEISKGEYDCLRWFGEADGRRCYSFMCSGVTNNASGQNGAVIVILDNTELVLAKDEALSANKAKSEFLSRVSHELRTPLNAILSMAKLGLRDAPQGKSAERFGQIASSSNHLSNIINDVLEMSRMESGKTEISFSPMSVSALIEECTSMLILKAQENNSELTYYIDPLIPERLIGDEFRMKQIILNLISNAIKFTDNGKISVEVVCAEKTENDYLLRFTVADTGIGISEDFLGRIFTPFEQEDNFMSRRYAGSGLGLSISHNLVLLMGGSMEVYSELGKGSRFVVSVRFEKCAEETGGLNIPEGKEVSGSAEHRDVMPGASVMEGKRLLLVDDIEINRIIIVEVMNEYGVKIEEASDGEEAVAKFMESPVGFYDCILMDIQMPKMNGYDATVAIRKSGRSDCNVPVVAMTANALKEDIDRAADSGINEHLAKPIDFDLCVKAVRKYCCPE